MGAEIITYNKIREVQREERTQTVITRLPENVIEQLQSYLSEKQGLLEKNKGSDNLFSQDMYSRVDYELKNARKSIVDIFELRQRKIIEQAFQTAKTDIKIKDTSNMLAFEKQLFNTLVELFSKYTLGCVYNIVRNNKPVLENISEEKVFKREEASSNKILVRVLSDMPTLLCEDNTTVGPLKREDVVFIPKKVGEILVKQKKAEEIR
ncbi:Uncharacterised protein [Candidatus Tiddalikarchaeum anstoanum]|nr:Uncharacterised protein [Candidatus Tiddalikarchaeum anstoanum]